MVGWLVSDRFIDGLDINTDLGFGDDCMNIWVYGCMSVWMYGCMSVWVYGCVGVYEYIGARE